MDQDRLLNDILDKAFELSGEERTVFIEHACKGNESLKQKVYQLIAGADLSAPEDFLAGHIPSPDLSEIMTDLDLNGKQFHEGDRIGVYEIIKNLGHGGMGEVYLAKRTDTEFQKQVALKVVKRGMATDEVLRRFDHERHILAQLDHAYIARLLHGGVTEDGLPYFVMEYVEGIPITEYCDQHKHTVIERLHLFQQVCDAVRYAQRNLVIHRDLKPENILVTSNGDVKLLDFGIAKLLEPSNAPITVYQTGGHIGPLTPAYAAPEQVLGNPVNAATDVYSLGVILYQLLTGRRPYLLRQDRGLIPENVEMICERVPSLPSSSVTRKIVQEGASYIDQLSAFRSTEPKRLRRLLQGDLDAIIMKALKKEPKNRYLSASELFLDIDRYLSNRPVEAQRDSTRYRITKFIQRNKIEVLAVTVALFALMGGLFIAIQSSLEAQREATLSSTMLSVLLGTFEDVNPENTQQPLIDPHRLIDSALVRISALEYEPRVHARLLVSMGQVSLSLGVMDRADSLLQKSLDLGIEEYGPNSELVNEALYLLGKVARSSRGFELAEEYHRRALDIRRRVLESGHPDLLESVNATRIHAVYCKARR